MLTPEESRFKRELVALYRSERGNLHHIGTEVESLRPLPAHDYATSPHRDRLFYQRFQWVPLRHPRIDFERPEAVCAALRATITEAQSRRKVDRAPPHRGADALVSASVYIDPSEEALR